MTRLLRLMRRRPVRLLARAITGYSWDDAGRISCEYWPCRACDRAGRTGWRERERWHADRRRRLTVLAILRPDDPALPRPHWWRRWWS